MNKKIKRALAFILALIFVLPVFPFDAFANYQSPIQDLIFTDMSTRDYRQAGSYSINMKFSNPPLSIREDASALYGSGIHDPDGYNLYWRNLSANEEYVELRKQAYSYESTSPVNKILTPSLEFGSLYMYKMVPWHLHTYRNSNPQLSDVTRLAPIESDDLTKEVLYLSDIRINATGTEKELTVEWDNPTFLGNDLFTSYKFYYASAGAGGFPATILEASSSSFEVDIRDPALLRNSVTKKLSYTLKDPNLALGTQYAIKVVPLYNGRRITEGNLVVTYRNKEYPIYSTNREYRTDDLNLRPYLEIAKEGKDFLKLSWSDYLSSLYDIDFINIYKSDTEDFINATNLGTISDPTAKYVNFFLVDRPENTTWYKIVINYVNGEGASVPLESMSARYNPAYEAFDPIKPTILEVTDVDREPYSLNITWEAFVRKAYTADEQMQTINDYGDIIDKGVLYDIYVTDDITNYDAANSAFLTNKIVDSIPASMLQMLTFNYMLGQDTIEKPAYKYNVNQYFTIENGGYVKKNIEDNKIYYIMIIAKRDPSGETSAKAFYSHYYAPKKDIPVRPIMVAKPPYRIKKDSDGIDVITKDSITVEWETNWYEVFNDSDNSWYSKIGVTQDNRVVFGKAADDLPKNKVIELNGSVYNKSSDPLVAYATIRADMTRLGISDPSLYALRFMDLQDASYDINVAPYDYIEERGGYETYADSLRENDWQTILPVSQGYIMEYTVKNTTTPNNRAIEPNTAYTVLLRPFRTLEDGRKEAYYPNYVVATTLSDRLPVDIKPTVPVIEAVSSTDTTITVRFEYLEGLSYELFWNELLSNYPANGTLINYENLKSDGTVRQDGGKIYMYYTINRLFPETTYHVWVRSYSDNTGTTEYSEYSNPVSLTTQEMSAPMPPEGLGLASTEHLDIYNKENETTWSPVDYNYMIIEWFRDINDTVISSGAAGPVTNNSQAAEILLSPNILQNYIVKYNDLIGNKGYYIRAKTVLTITKTADGIMSYYQYVVQMSPDIDFADVIEIIVPGDTIPTDPVYTLVKQSAWTRTVRLVTKPYTGEYDGNKYPDTVPLPKQDFELSYDDRTDTLTYRYRSDEIDNDGNRDNRVDQRFISTLVARKIFAISIDLSAYNGRVVKNGAVEMPYSILRSLKERKISLSITSNGTTFTLMPGFVETPEVKALNNLGDMSKIKITIDSVTRNLPAILDTEDYVTDPKKLAISVTTQTNTVNLTSLANPYKAELKLTNRYLTIDKNTGAYTYTPNDVNWVRVPDATYEKETGQITMHLQKLANYSAIAKPLPKAISSNGDELSVEDNAIYTVGTLINITDMPTYNPNASVTSNQLNKLMSAIASGKKEVALNEALTDDEEASLSKAGLLTTGDTLTREEGLNALINLYERKTKSTIKNFDTVAQTQYEDIASATPEYQKALLKAADLGFFEDALASSPKENLTVGDMLKMADFIIQDAGL